MTTKLLSLLNRTFDDESDDDDEFVDWYLYKNIDSA